MTHRESYILGWVYGLIDRTLQARTGAGVPDNPNPSARPITSSALAIQTGEKEAIMDDLYPQIDAAYSKLSYLGIGMPESVQPIDFQKSWQMGYHHAIAGMALSVPTDIVVAKIVQVQLTEEIGEENMEGPT